MPSLIHSAVGASSGSPARNRARSDDRSWRFNSDGSCFFSTRIAVGDENITDTLYFSTSRHQMPPSGCLPKPCVGRPSYINVVMPAINGP